MDEQINILDSRILVVDDEPVNVEILDTVLRKDGFSSRSERREGLAMYAQIPEDRSGQCAFFIPKTKCARASNPLRAKFLTLCLLIF